MRACRPQAAHGDLCCAAHAARPIGIDHHQRAFLPHMISESLMMIICFFLPAVFCARALTTLKFYVGCLMVACLL